MCTVIFLGISVLPPGINLFLLNGVCFLQVILDIINCIKETKIYKFIKKSCSTRTTKDGNKQTQTEYTLVPGTDQQELSALPADQKQGLPIEGQDMVLQSPCRKCCAVLIFLLFFLSLQVTLMVYPNLFPTKNLHVKAFISLALGMSFFSLFWSRNAQPNWIAQLTCTLTCKQGAKIRIHQKSRTMYKSSKCRHVFSSGVQFTGAVYRT